MMEFVLKMIDSLRRELRLLTTAVLLMTVVELVFTVVVLLMMVVELVFTVVVLLMMVAGMGGRMWLR